MRNWALLLARLTIAGCVLPAAVVHASNISGFALAFWMKGMPVPHAVATACVMAELAGALFLVLGVAPPLTASAMIRSLVITTGTFHRFWDVVGAARAPEQAIFLGNLAIIAALTYYALTGPGEWSWRALWARVRSSPAKSLENARKKPTGARPPRAKKAPAQEGLAEAA